MVNRQVNNIDEVLVAKLKSFDESLTKYCETFNNKITSGNANEAIQRFNKEWIEITDYLADETTDRQSKYGLALISCSVAMSESNLMSEAQLKMLSDMIVQFEHRDSVKFKFGILISLFGNLGFCWHKLGKEYDGKAIEAFKKYLFYLLSISSHTIYRPTAYRFVKYNDYLLKSLKEQKISVSSPVKFNDPFDCPIKNLLDNDDEISALIRKAYGDCLRIGCFMSNVKLPFSQNPNDIASDIVYDEPKHKGDCEEFLDTSMWDRYADEGKGVCIKYRFSSSLTRIGRDDETAISYFKDVEYSSKRLNEYPDKTEINIFDAFFLKGDKWRQENELRYLYFDLNGDSEYSMVDAQDCIEAVYFGYDCPQSNKDKIKEALAGKKLVVTDLSGNTNIKDVEFYQIVKVNSKLQLCAVKE